MICPHCAYPNDPQDQMCGKCNQPLHKSADYVSTPGQEPKAARHPSDEQSIQASPSFVEQGPKDDINTLLQTCIEEAQQKKQAGDLRSAFLVCQAFVMDHYGEIPEQAMVALYTTMGQISNLQGKTERAAKYLQKAEMINAGYGPTGIPSQTSIDQDSTPKETMKPPPIQKVASTQDDGFDDMEDIDESLDSDQSVQGGPTTTHEPSIDAFTRPSEPRMDSAFSTTRPRRMEYNDKTTAGTTGEHRALTAGFFVRLASFIMDIFVVTILIVLMSLISSSILDEQDQNTFQLLLDQPSALLLGCTMWILLLMVYQCMFSRYGGQTMGKVLLGIQVVGLDGSGISTKNAILRSIGLLVAGLPALAGFFWVGFDTHRRGWHDYLGGTLVIQLNDRDKKQIGS